MKIQKLSKPYLYLGVACLALVLVWIVERPTEQETGDLLSKPLLEDFDSKQIYKIEIEHLFNGVQLKKEKEAWQVAGLQTKLNKDYAETQAKEKNQAPAKPPEAQWQPADPSKIDFSLDVLGETLLTSMVGANKETQGWFEVNAASLQLKLFDAAGKKIVHLHLGKTSPNFMESYLRFDGKNEVYQVNRQLRSLFPVEAESWVTQQDEDHPKPESPRNHPQVER